MYFGTQKVGAGDLWTHSLQTYIESSCLRSLRTEDILQWQSPCLGGESDVYVQPPTLKK